MSKQKYTITIEPLTAVHIGTGEELTPLDYKVADSKQGNKLYVKFSSDSILDRLVKENKKEELVKFERASVNGNMQELQKFFQKNCTGQDIDYICSMTKKFYAAYLENAKKDPLENAAKVLQMYRPEGQPNPVIPGSSLKGSIRTAVLNNRMSKLSDDKYNNLLDTVNNSNKYGKPEKEIQQVLLDNVSGKEKTDPFRSVLIGDATFQSKGSQLVGQMKNISFNQAEQELSEIPKLQIQAEVIKGILSGLESTSEFSLTIDTDLQKTELQNKFSIDSILLDEIRESCNYFYMREFKTEYEKFYKDAVDGVDLITKLNQVLSEINNSKNQFMIRVGRWSQVEFVTLEENFRHPKTPKLKDKVQGYGGTRTVFDLDGEYLPMGWCKCTIN